MNRDGGLTPVPKHDLGLAAPAVADSERDSREPGHAHLSCRIYCALSLFFHPLARIPGPRLAALSNVWLARHARDGRMLGLGKRLHKAYGPMVRVGPDELWFDSSEAFRQIYRKRFCLFGA